MYARVVTFHVLPGKSDEVTTLFAQSVLPMVQRQAGFNGIFVLSNPEADKEVSVCLWETREAIEMINTKLMCVVEQFAPFLAAAPDIEIFQVSLLAEDGLVHEILFHETSLGIRIEDPFGKEVEWVYE